MPLALPLITGFTNSRFGLETNTQRFESPFTKATQRAALGGSRWTASLSLPPMKRDRAAVWQAFFLQLEGGANTFFAFDPDAPAPRGQARLTPGTPLVNGANQSGSALAIDGCPASVVNYLLPGDYFGVNGELKMVVAPVSTNGSGQVTLTFKPALRNKPADNAPVTLVKPTCTMALVDDQQAIWECDVTGVYQPKTFTAVEVFA